MYTESSGDGTSRQKISSVQLVHDRVLSDTCSYERRNVIPQATTCDVQGSDLLFGNQEGLFLADLRAESFDPTQQIKWDENYNKGVDPVAALHPLDLGSAVVVDGELGVQRITSSEGSTLTDRRVG